MCWHQDGAISKAQYDVEAVSQLRHPPFPPQIEDQIILGHLGTDELAAAALG